MASLHPIAEDAPRVFVADPLGDSASLPPGTILSDILAHFGVVQGFLIHPQTGDLITDALVAPDGLGGSEELPENSYVLHVGDPDEYRKTKEHKITVPDQLPYWHDHYGSAVESVTVNGMAFEYLIRKLTAPNFRNDDLARVVLLTHTNFVPSTTLLGWLCLRFSAPPDLSVNPDYFFQVLQPQLQLNVLHILRLWVEGSVYDFADNPELLDVVTVWLQERDTTHDAVAQRMNEVHDALVSALAAYPGLYVLSEDAFSGRDRRGKPDSILLTAGDVNSITELHPVELARQLTLRDFKLFFCVRRCEFLKQAWQKHPDRAPNLLASIERFNDVSSWAATEILQAESEEERVHKICILLETAEECESLNNFSSLMAIVSALQGSAITRLKYTWQRVEAAFLDKFNHLCDVMSMELNFKSYRDRLHAAPAPCVPYLGVFVQDLTFIDDGNPSRVGHDEAMINIEKQRMTAKTIDEIFDGTREGNYNFHVVTKINDYLDSCEKWSEQAQYAQSLVIEPRGMKPQGRRSSIVHISQSRSTLSDEGPTGGGGDIDATFVNRIMESMVRESYASGEYIVREGEPGSCLYFISSGNVVVEFPNGGEAILNQGAYFGEIALFLKQPRTASVRADTDVIALALSKEVVEMVLADFPDVAQQFEAVSRARLEELNQGKKKKKGESIGWLKAVANKVAR